MGEFEGDDEAPLPAAVGSETAPLPAFIGGAAGQPAAGRGSTYRDAVADAHAGKPEAGDEAAAQLDATAPADIMPLARIMARLRDPVRGCAWDVEQDFATIAPYTIEEAYEVADAIQRGDMAALKDELGDLLLQVVFHARMAEEAGHFALDDVIQAICGKMIRRHPHVFAEPGQARGDWEAIKAAERAEASTDASALAGVAVTLPALLRAEKLQKRAARTGFDWPDTGGAVAKIHEELAEVEAAANAEERQEEIGDLLFAVVNLARHYKVDPETALRKANYKFEGRFRGMERFAGDGFAGLSLEEKEALWQRVKRGSE